MATVSRRRTAVLVAGTFFMEILDGTILATAAPDIAVALGVQAADVGVAITAYLVSLAVLIPVSGWLADRWGTRTVFLTGIVVFTLASGLCALSTSLLALSVLRVLQGAGGALMVPVGRLVVLRDTAKVDLIRAIALLTWPALVAPVVAPLAGGLLTTYLSWHWIFLINLPLGLVAAACAVTMVPQHQAATRRPMDWSGFWQVSACMAALVLALSALGSPATPWPFVSVAGGCGVLLAATSLRHLRRSEHPLLDLEVFRIETFRLPHATGSLFRATVSAVPFVLPLMFQERFGWSAVQAGAMVMAVFAGNLAVKPLTTAILRRWPFRTVIAASVLVVSATMLLCAFITPTTSAAVVVALLVTSGAARSVGFTAYGTLAFADVEAPQMTAASTLSATVHQLAGGFGVAIGALGLQLGAAVGGEAAAPAMPYQLTFVLLALLTLGCLVGAAGLAADAGHRLNARARPPA